jgi:hypothetical protein
MSPEPTLIRVYLRAWTTRSNTSPLSTRKQGALPEIRAILVLDTETTTDPTQRLAFGSARYYRVHSEEGVVRLILRDEWLFYADDLPERDPEGFGILTTYAAQRKLKLYSRTKFVDWVFWRAAYKLRATVVGFNLPFDLSRLAQGWGTARRDPGFSLRMWGGWKDGRWDDHPWRPRLGVLKLAPGRALIRFRRAKEVDPEHLIPEGEWEPDPAYTFTGHFLDVYTLVFALTNQRPGLARACDMFNVEVGKGTVEAHGEITPEYIDYNRRDVEATASLFEKVYGEYRRHPVDLQPTKAYSPASMGKAYLRAMGVIPPLEKWPRFPDRLLGEAMTAYYGGRAECRIRHTPVPVVTVDFLSMYTTVCSLIGVWRMLTAARLARVEATAEVRAVLDRAAAGGPEAILDPSLWAGLAGFAQIQPHGDIVPVRADYGTGDQDRPQIGVNPFWADEPLWYTIPDLVASALLTGRAPQVLQAVRLIPKGTQKGLKKVRFRGDIEVDPTSDDFFRLVVEERKRSQHRTDLTIEEQDRLNTGLKTVANATGYGITAEMIRQDGEHDTVTVYGLGEPFQVDIDHPEQPGAFCFPPFAAVITGGARLLLAILERLVIDWGGTYLNCDTDSMAITATSDGGLVPCRGGSEKLEDGTDAIRALTYAQVDEIIDLIDRVHPYDRKAVPESLLEIERENHDPDTGRRRQLWGLATSAKRYVLWNQTAEGIKIRKASEHGLGHLLEPTGQGSRAFAEAAWRIVLAQHLNITAPDADWLDRPAVSRLVASTPYLLNLFKTYNQGKTYAEQVKPFGFMLSATPQRIAGILLGTDRLHLIAPYETDPTKWTDIEWTDIHTGNQHQITTSLDPGPPHDIPVQTLQHMIKAWATNPELKSLGTDGQACGRQTKGLLHRRPVRTVGPLVTMIGKETNHLQEAQAGILGRSEILNEYPDPDRDTWQTLLLPAITLLGAPAVAYHAGLDRRTVERAVRGSRPGRDTRARITATVVQLIARNVHTSNARSRTLPLLVEFVEKAQQRCCQQCGASLAAKRRDARFCGDRCRMKHQRSPRTRGVGRTTARDRVEHPQSTDSSLNG